MLLHKRSHRISLFFVTLSSCLCSAGRALYAFLKISIPGKIKSAVVGSQDRSAYSAAGKYVVQSWEYRQQHMYGEWGNWDCGLAIPFLGVHKWDFRCSADID
jgi:hypothetical protein